MRPARVHYLRSNEVERSPHRLFVWDTETRTIADGAREVLPLRLWCAETVQRHGRRPRQPRVQAHHGLTAVELLDTMGASCRSTETTWAFAHNLGFDLAVTRLPLLLVERGWVITAHALTTASPWARLQRGGHRLVLADSSSWLPGKLEAIGVSLGLVKPELPREDGVPEDWWYRCRQDVVILRTALLELLDWWDRNGMGSWSITGPQTGFNAMRHRPTPHTVVIDPDPQARRFERDALLGGRREVWRVGLQPWGDYREVDFRAAHATVCAHLPLPKRRSARFESMELDDWRLDSDRWAPIAECTIRTNTPRYPLRHQGRLWYPVGTFRTVLCGPELREARRRQELLAVGPGWVYQLGQHMGPWGRWVLDQLGREDPDTPAVGRTAIRAWSRNVPGKWASRTGRTIHQGPALEQGWNVEHGRHHPSLSPVAVLDMAGHREVVLQDQDADDSFPAVLAWVQSEVRVRLGRLIDHVGPERMLSCNTDGLFCEGVTDDWEHMPQAAWSPLRVREKQRVPWVDVISPQHLVMPQERRLAGVPAGADEVAPRKFSWMAWGRLPAQIASGERRGYVRERRSVDLSTVPVNRWVWEGGTCTPVQAEVTGDAVTRLQLPHTLQGPWPTDGLRPIQHPVLAQLLGALG